MGDTHKVSTDQLLKISDNLTHFFFFSPNIYALLVLSLITVTTYSRTINYLDTQTRVSLTIKLLDDLINRLRKRGVITRKIVDNLKLDCEINRQQLSVILWAYLYAEYGLTVRTK